jgi:hypothetical protein
MTIRYNMANIYINRSDTDSDVLAIPAVLSDVNGMAIAIYQGANKLVASTALAALTYALF